MNTMIQEYLYLRKLKLRQQEESLRKNVIFGQTLGWILSLTGGFKYFILSEPSAYYLLMIGNALLLLGLALPQALELPQLIMRRIGEFIGTVILRTVLILIYVLVVAPCGFLIQKFNGSAPFYYWNDKSTINPEGWTQKQPSDEKGLVLDAKHISSHHGIQLLQHFLRHGDMIIMPSLIIILLLGLVSIFAQSTVVAPMIYTLF